MLFQMFKRFKNYRNGRRKEARVWFLSKKKTIFVTMSQLDRMKIFTACLLHYGPCR